jgi:hypothetical protein
MVGSPILNSSLYLPYFFQPRYPLPNRWFLILIRLSGSSVVAALPAILPSDRQRSPALSMSSRSHLMPWTTSQKYTPKQTFDEESNKPITVMASGLPRTHFKLLSRIIRPVFTLLILGVLAQLYLQLSAKLNLTVLEDPLLEPDNDWSLSYDTTAPSYVDWAKYAYTQYVTNSIYLCNSLMVFESLHRLGSEAERLMMYPEEWSIEAESSDAWLLRRARDEYDVKLQPVQIQRLEGDIIWGESFTKLLAFNQTQYKRVISLDSDANVLQVNTVLHDLLCITLKC